MEAASSPARRPATGRPFPRGVSGNPAGKGFVKDRAEALYVVMAADIQPQTATDELLLRHAALLLARAQRIRNRKDIDASCRLSSEARRLIMSLRRNAPASATAPAEAFTDIAAVAQTAEAARRAAELAADASEALDGSEETDGASGCQTPADDETLTAGRAKGRRRPSDGDGEAA
jgi:hypothetical protein